MTHITPTTTAVDHMKYMPCHDTVPSIETGMVLVGLRPAALDIAILAMKIKDPRIPQLRHWRIRALKNPRSST